MPADPLWSQPGVKVQPVRTASMVKARDILLSESHSNGPTVAIIGYAFFVLMFGTVIILLGLAYTVVNRRVDMPYGGGPWPQPPRTQKEPKPKLRPARGSGVA
jgi:hypothetical protein